MGMIINVLDWRWAFYITALLSLILSVVWLRTVADSPEKHPTISRPEKEFIEESLELVLTKKQDFPPYAKMFRSRPFYAFAFLHFSDVWGVFFLLTSTPMFMSQVLKYDLKNAGIASSFPYIARLIFGFIFGAAGDHLMKRGVSSTTIRKVFCIFCKLSLHFAVVWADSVLRFSSHHSRSFPFRLLLHREQPIHMHCIDYAFSWLQRRCNDDKQSKPTRSGAELCRECFWNGKFLRDNKRLHFTSRCQLLHEGKGENDLFSRDV